VFLIVLSSCVFRADSATFRVRVLDEALCSVEVADFLTNDFRKDRAALRGMTFKQLENVEITFRGRTEDTARKMPSMRALCWMSHLNMHWARRDQAIIVKREVEDPQRELNYWSDGDYDRANVANWAQAAAEFAFTIREAA
jgi:hypothetical protein